MNATAPESGVQISLHRGVTCVLRARAGPALPGMRTTRSDEFRERYFLELQRNPEAIAQLDEHVRRGAVKLVYGAKDSEYNHIDFSRLYPLFSIPINPTLTKGLVLALDSNGRDNKAQGTGLFMNQGRRVLRERLRGDQF